MHEQKFNFVLRKAKGDDFRKDKGNFAQKAIIVSALAFATIITLAGIFILALYFSQHTEKSTEEAISENSESSNSTEENKREKFKVPNPDECFVLDGETIIGYKVEEEQCSSDVVIPNEIDGQIITRIENRAHSTRDSNTGFSSIGITGVVFNDHIEYIGNGSFEKSELGQIVLPKTIKSVGYNAFSSSGIKGTLIIPGTIENIQDNSFSDNEILDLKIEPGVNTIGGYAFSINKQPMKVEIPDSVQSIGEYAFHASKITDIKVGSGVKKIGEYAFYGNPDLNISGDAKFITALEDWDVVL